MVSSICVIVTLSICSLLTVNAVEVKEENDVLVLNRANFKQIVDEKDTLLVEFYAPWCGHCKQLEPNYAAAAKQLKEKNIALGKVDATVEPGLAGDFGVEGYPTLKIFKKAFPGESFEYEGPRDTEGIVGFMENVAQPSWKPPFQLSGLQQLTSANISEALEKQASWLVGFIDSEAQRSELLEAAKQLKRGRERKAVGFVDVSEEAGRNLAASFSVQLQKLPVFVVLHKDRPQAVEFGYGVTADNLVKFYRAHSSERAPPPQEFEKLSDLEALNDGVESLLIGHFSSDSRLGQFLKNFLIETGFMFDRKLEGGTVSKQLAKQLGIESEAIYVRRPSKLLAKAEQQVLRFNGQAVAEQLKEFYDTVSLPLVGYYTWNTKELYRKADKPLCLFMLTVSFKGEMQSSTAMWHAKIAKAVAPFSSKVLFAMADDEQDEDEVKAFRLDDTSADINVGCYDASKRRYAMPEMDSFDADEIGQFIQSVLDGKAKQVIRSVTARASALTGPVIELTGDTFNKLIINDNERHSAVLQCDFSLQPCQHSISEFAAAAAAAAASGKQSVRFAKLDTKFNDAPGNYFYRFNPNDKEMAQPILLLGLKSDKLRPITFPKEVISKDYVIQFINDNVNSAKVEL